MMQNDQEDTSVRREDLLFTAASRFTGAYLVLVVLATALNFAGYDRWLFGFNPDIESNAVGDTLAGTFAPLAFLWFFVSTWLQRKELKESREELAKQAQESANQTKIMQVRAEYDEHRQRLYYLAAYLVRDGINISLLTDTETISLIDPPSIRLSEENGSVDAIIEVLGRSQAWALSQLSGRNVTPVARIPLMSAALDQIADELETLVRSERYRANPLVLARIRGTGLDQITNTAVALADKVREYLVQDA
ncbi:hypothetical protein DC522_01395 [Microvirga sp. KLBC 81]|uniref:hypothetical protein n=1 Tax=Microvirga sp. KLBC 81 TaxID=1862707 RepID=UPI000D51D038|nr:hypothetical protein [Microvirga sp. KLBC 81]PVE26446.1 hypothetical protein DC522_01395 [Microvirga sp. KLBC 81]